MLRRTAIVSIVVAALGLPLASAAAADAPAAVPGPGPQQLIEKASHEMLEALDADRAAYKKDPAKVDALVDRILLPHFDTALAARLVLGKYWRTATPEQRKRFVDAFYHSLLSKYGAALANFTADRMTILPFRGDLASGRATVRTEVTTDDGKRVPVDYSMYATPQGWKAWDVTIEGISYVKNYRTDFGSEVEQKGLDELITRLETEAKAPHAGS